MIRRRSPNSIRGLSEVMRNLRETMDDVKGLSAEGAMRGMNLLMKESQKVVPVEYGKLRDSGFVEQHRTGVITIEVGYTAPYAMYVHENMEQKLKGKPRPSGIGVYWGPRGQPKFLEAKARELTPRIIEIVRDYANRGLKKRRRRAT